MSPNRLGLQRTPNATETAGWVGPDREHWFYGSLFTSALLTGSDLCQWLLEAQSRIVWYQETVAPNLSTSGTDAARSLGWFGIIAMSLDQCLRSDHTRAMVRSRAKARLEQVYLPNLASTGQWNIWDIRSDNRLLQGFRHRFVNITMPGGEIIPGPLQELPAGATWWHVEYDFERAWMPYQQALGSYGLHILGRMFDNQAALNVAQHAADTVVKLAYLPDPNGMNGLTTWATLPIKSGTLNEPIDPSEYYSALAHGTQPLSWFRHAWLPLAVWVRSQSLDPLALMWWDVIYGEAEQGDHVMQWMPPLNRAQVASPSHQ